MLINLGLLLLGFILDSISAFIFSTDFSYQSMILHTFFVINLFVCLTFDTKPRDRWILAMFIALVYEIFTVDSTLFWFLVMAVLLVGLNYLQKGIGSSALVKLLVGTVSVFIVMTLLYLLYSAIGRVDFSWSLFVRRELFINILINVPVAMLALWLDSVRKDYIERKGMNIRRQEKIDMFHPDKL